MKLDRLIRESACAVLLAIACVAVHASPMPPQTPQQSAAGKITALIPTSSVLHERKSLEAKKDMEVFWLDTVKTDRGGRARVRLEDGSILNVGSQASLVVTKHDPGSQQTDLELIYGKVRADVNKITTPDGHFEIHTKVAVCGVVGTEEYLEATDLATTVIALGGGQVRVSSADPSLPGVTLLNPGEAVSVIAGHAPGPKRLATSQELQNAVQDTEGETGATIDPGASLAGRTFDAVITGKDLAGTRSVSSSQAGLTVKTRGAITSTEIPVTITIDSGVPVGAYSLTIDRPQGPAIAGFAVASAPAIQLAQSAGGTIQPPPSQDYTVTRGAKVQLDASSTRTPSGTQIVAYQWTLPNTVLAVSGSVFPVNTSLLNPGSYTVQLTVVNDQGQVGTQQYPLVVDAGVQPFEIVRDLASAYESLQPSAFLKNFDEERFRNYAGFAATIEDSFRNDLETMRVFQRPVNCAVVEEQDQGVCQAEFQVQFTLKNQTPELLDAHGNPIPAGTTPPPNATLGKRILTGTEQDTIRFERGNAGWKVVDYAAVVNCPNGGSTTGLNVGSCVFAQGSGATPSFRIVNLQLFSTDLPLGGSVSGSFTVVPAGGFTSAVNFSGQGQVGNQSVTVQFSPNSSGPTGTVNFTVFAPSTAPSGVNGPASFTLVIIGSDTSGAVTASANASLVLQPDFNLSLQPATTASSPAPVTQNSTLPVAVQVVASAGFMGTVFIDFPNLPTGFTVSPGNVAIGGQGSFPLTISAAAEPGPALITVRGTLSSGAIRTATLFLNVISDFTLSVTPASSQATPAHVLAGGTLQVTVQVVPISGFAGSVAVDFPNLPAGFTVTGGNVPGGGAIVTAGGTVAFQVQNTLQASTTVFQITIRGRFGSDVQSILLFVQVVATIPIQAPALHSQASVYAVQPAKLNPGDVVEGELFGSNLSGVTAVQVSGSGIKVDVLESSATEVRVRFTVDPNIEPGSRLISLGPGARKATTTIDVSSAANGSSKSYSASTLQPADQKQGDKLPAPAVADPRAAQDSAAISPANPKPGDGSARPSTGRDDRGASSSASRNGKSGYRETGRQRGELRLPVGSCAGFRLTSGSDQSCGGSADFEVSSLRDRAVVVIEADGVRNLGGVPLDQAEEDASDALSSSTPLLAGNTYLVKSPRGLAIVRVVQIRGIESVRNAPPAGLRGPRLSTSDREVLGSSGPPDLTLVLEWKILQP
jgi:FecR protein